MTRNILTSLLSLLFLAGLPAQAQNGFSFGNEAPPAPRVQSQLLGGPAPDGQSYLLGLELNPEAGWHTYWRNSGDAGLPTRLNWTLPEGATLGEVHWPLPHAYPEGELMTYGYGEPHMLLQSIQLPEVVPDDAEIELQARWLVCKDICIPESMDFSLTVGELRQLDESAQRQLQAALRQIPEALELEARFAWEDGRLRSFLPLPPSWLEHAEDAEWFIASRNLIDHATPPRWYRQDGGLRIEQSQHQYAESAPEIIPAVLVIHSEGQRRAVEVQLTPGDVPSGGQAWLDTPSVPAKAGGELGLWIALLMAFAGGIILNLMPCVLPVLTLKAMSLARAEHYQQRRMESLAYTAGVLASFLLFAGLLLALRAGGAALGWGFQLQNPIVVGVLAALMVIMSLALLGWTQIGMRMMGLGQGLSNQHGLRGAFFTGVLAVVVASPCSAPFMGGALGYAVLQPPALALSIFAALGLGLAAPFLLVAWVPALAHRLPRPGPWMETLKHWLALPLFLTGLWLFWVLWRQTDGATLGFVLLATGLLALAIRHTPSGWQPSKALSLVATLAALALLFSPMWWSPTESTAIENSGAERWQDWSSETVQKARQDGRMILVDFTADWCLSCIVNERAVLSQSQVIAELEAQDALLLKADWTEYDPAITAALAEFGRNGVPLYLLYPPDGGPARVLPQILTKGIVLDAIRQARSAQN